MKNQWLTEIPERLDKSPEQANESRDLPDKSPEQANEPPEQANESRDLPDALLDTPETILDQATRARDLAPSIHAEPTGAQDPPVAIKDPQHQKLEKSAALLDSPSRFPDLAIESPNPASTLPDSTPGRRERAPALLAADAALPAVDSPAAHERLGYLSPVDFEARHQHQPKAALAAWLRCPPFPGNSTPRDGASRAPAPRCGVSPAARQLQLAVPISKGYGRRPGDDAVTTVEHRFGEQEIRWDFSTRF